MNVFQLEHCPIWIVSGLMLAAAVWNLRTLSSPNWLSLPSILAGWVVALLGQTGILPWAEGDILASLACTILGGALLLPFYVRGGLGAGCVKMQAACGAWVGAHFGFSTAAAITAAATLIGVALTAGCAADAVIGAKFAADQDAPELPLLPAQATLSVGAVATLIGAMLLGYV